MSSKKHKGAPRSGEGEVITEPRFAKAHTDRRFAKIGHKDKTVHLDSRFKHVVKERKFAISGQKDSRGRVGDVLSKAKARRQTKELKQQFHVDSDEDKGHSSDSDGPQSTLESDVSDHTAQPKTQAAQAKKKKYGVPQQDSDAASYAKFAVEDDEVSSEDNDAETDDYWARKARDTDEEMDAEELEEYNEGVLQQPIEFGMVNSVTIYPSDFGLSMMAEEDMNGPAIYKDEDASLEDESDSEDGSGANGRRPRDEERAAALDQIKLRRYELNKLRYYFAVIVCDSIATASAVYSALDDQEIEMTSNKLDMRFVPDDISFDDRAVHDKCTEVPANYEAPSFYTTVLQKTEAKLTWDQTPKDRLDITQAAFSHLGEIDEAKYAALIASSESESEEGESEEDKVKLKPVTKAVGDEKDKSKIKEKERKKYAALLMGLDNLEDEDNQKDDFFADDGPKEMTFSLGGNGKSGNTDTVDIDEQIRRKVEERLSRKPSKKFKENNRRSVVPKYRPDEKHEEDGENGIELYPDRMDVDEADFGSADKEDENGGSGSSDESDSEVRSHKASKASKGDKSEKDIWAGFEEGFDKPSKSKLAKMKKRKREDREKELKSDTKTRAELELLMGKDRKLSEDASDNTTDDDQPAKKKAKRGKKDKKEVTTDIDLTDTRFHGLFKDPRFMPDPTNPNFKKTAAVSAILEARKEYRKKSDARGDETEEMEESPIGSKASKASTSAATSSSSAPRKTTQKGFYDMGTENKDDSADALASLVASVKRKATSQTGQGSLSGRSLRS